MCCVEEDRKEERGKVGFVFFDELIDKIVVGC